MLLVAALLVPAGVSYGRALTAPGDAGRLERTVEWVRDHGGSGLVDTLENWWYARRPPAAAAPSPDSLPDPAPGGTPDSGETGVAAAGPAPLPPPSGSAPLPGEARWVPAGQRVRGIPVLYTGWFRPDPAYPNLIVGAAWMDQTRTATRLIAGTVQPGGARPDEAQVPTGLRSTLVAAFNSGWKMKDSRGGYYADGRTAVALQDGAASLVIDTSGRATVGQWGRDVTMSPDIAAVRQNLNLVVDGGRTVPGLADNADGAWGSVRNQFQYTWRSGVGVDRAGNVIYVAGDQLRLSGLADAMVAAGVQRGMELDIHTGKVGFNSYHPQPGSPFALAATRLLPQMPLPATRYLQPDQRDFFAVTLRDPALSGAGIDPLGTGGRVAK